MRKERINIRVGASLRTDLLGLILYWHWPNASEHAFSIFACMLVAVYALRKYGYHAFIVIPGFVLLFYDAVFKAVNLAVFGEWTWGPLNIVSLTLFALLYWILGYRFPTWTVPVVLLSYVWTAQAGFQYSYGFGAPASSLTAFWPNFREVVTNLSIAAALGLQLRFGGLKSAKT